MSTDDYQRRRRRTTGDLAVIGELQPVGGISTLPVLDEPAARQRRDPQGRSLGRTVWIKALPDAKEAFEEATVLSAEGRSLLVRVGGAERQVVLGTDAWSVNAADALPADGCQLGHVSQPALLHWLRRRAEQPVQQLSLIHI